jgi:hypothetical protein
MARSDDMHLGDLEQVLWLTPKRILNITLVPDAGALRIEIKGELAGILERCREGANRKPGALSTAGLAKQIKMVAGARNHLYRTRVIALLWR